MSEQVEAQEEVTIETTAVEVEDNSSEEANAVSDEESESEESGEESESSQEDDEGEKEEAKPKKVNSYKKRINKLRAREEDAKRERDYWKQEALKNQAKESKQDDSQAKVVDKNSGKPSESDFESYEEYEESLFDWKVEKRFEKQSKGQEAEQINQSQDKKVQGFNKGLIEFKKVTTDFAEVMENADHIDVSDTFDEIILGSKLGPQLVYAIAKNPEEAERINSLPPLEMAREIGKIEATLIKSSSQTKKVTKKTTSAPAPISTVRGSGKITKDIKDMSFLEYETYRKRQRSKGA